MVADATEGGEISVEENEKLVAIVDSYRESANEFEFTKFGTTTGPDDTPNITADRKAGATSWVEPAMPGADVRELIDKLKAGPPKD